MTLVDEGELAGLINVLQNARFVEDLNCEMKVSVFGFQLQIGQIKLVAIS